MEDKILNQNIVLKKYIGESDYREINKLKELCLKEDKVNLKLELEYKMRDVEDYEKAPNNINEYLYYINDELAGYIGIGSFGRNVAEINGVVHPKWRRKGVFTKLCQLAVEESRRRKFDKILLLCDDKSESAIEFIKNTGAVFSFSETGMKLEGSNHINYITEDVILRKASNSDVEEIVRQNEVYFEGAGSEPAPPEQEENNGTTTYIVELQGKAIGKIKVSIDGTEGFISGFGIMPEYRRKGYGRQALRSAINILNNSPVYGIALDVSSKNRTALNLYKSCGFEEISTMNYYEIK
jgi:ribosomal protein S18 acetylase RimI-like enzyme